LRGTGRRQYADGGPAVDDDAADFYVRGAFELPYAIRLPFWPMQFLPDKPSRRKFLIATSALAAALPVASWERASAANPPKGLPALLENTPQTLVGDPRLGVKFGAERLVLDDGLQPSMLCTKAGTLIVQSQLSKKPHPQERIFYPYAVATVVSRDGGETWTEFLLPPGDNGVNIEGGICQLKDGTILALETYVTPGKAADQGSGLVWTSTDDYRTLSGPEEMTFHIPAAQFHGSSDDGGRPHAAMRLHRRVLELPGGDLLTTLYGWLEGDNEPSGYTPTMRKTRCMLLRSTNRGRHWEFVSTIAVDPKIGTEGFGEPVLARASRGPHAGRLICQMRTGRDLYEARSDDEGKTWSPAKPRVYADIDVYKTDLWAEMFRGFKRKGQLISENPNEYIGAVVDPDLIELRSGILVAAFGVRIPPRACWSNPKHAWNGNYLAFSVDHGQTWSHVIRLTSGVDTTHYMAIEEMPTDNKIFVVYDMGHWGYKYRYTCGRTVEIEAALD
jgi:hypothetical protein